MATSWVPFWYRVLGAFLLSRVILNGVILNGVRLNRYPLMWSFSSRPVMCSLSSPLSASHWCGPYLSLGHWRGPFLLSVVNLAQPIPCLKPLPEYSLCLTLKWCNVSKHHHCIQPRKERMCSVALSDVRGMGELYSLGHGDSGTVTRVCHLLWNGVSCDGDLLSSFGYVVKLSCWRWKHRSLPYSS